MKTGRIQRLKFRHTKTNGLGLEFIDDRSTLEEHRNGYHVWSHKDARIILNCYSNDKKYKTAGCHENWQAKNKTRPA